MRRVFSAGGAVYKIRSGETLWLVYRARPSELYPEEIWRLPKGIIDQGESVEEAAVREVKEETGVEAVIVKKIFAQKLVFKPRGEKEKIFKVVTYFLMKYVGGVETGFTGEETAEVAWLPYSEAKRRLSYSGEKKILDLA